MEAIVLAEGMVTWQELLDPSCLAILRTRRRPDSVLAFQCAGPRWNFRWFAHARAAGIPAMPLRFPLHRELGVLGEHQLVQSLDREVSLLECPQLAEGLTDCLYLNMSSGTSSTRTIAFPTARQLEANAKSCVDFFSLGDGWHYWCTFPFYAHAHELFSKADAIGHPVLALNSTDLAPIQALLADRQRKLHILTTPQVAQSFLARHLRPVDPAQIRFELAGEYVAPGLIRRLKEQGFAVCVSWGSAETSGVALGDLQPRHPGSLGLPLPGYRLGTLQFGQEMNLHLEGEAIPSFLAREGRLIPTHQRFSSQDKVLWDGSNLLFRGRTDSFLKYHGTLIDITAVEGWAKEMEGVDNAFLSLFEEERTHLVLFVQCADRALWNGIREGLAAAMTREYGGIRLRVELATELGHTPTGKLIRDPAHQVGFTR
jgi:acyl-coenzyme A synthetase/AMP-(fatty) acid ligase